MRSRETAASNIKTVMLSHVRLLLGSSHDSAPTKDILKIKCEFLEEKLIDALLANDALKDINDSLREEIDAPTPWHSVVYHQSASSQTDSKIFPHLDTATQTCGNPTPATSIAFTQTTKPKTKRRLCQTDSINCSSDFSSQANLSVPVASCATQCEQAPAAPPLGAQQPSTPPTSGPPVPQSDVIFGQEKKIKSKFLPKFGSKFIVQCYQCQGFGHKSFSCPNPPKCVKCGLGHKTQVCTKPPELPASCANCSQGHTANYAKCPSFRAYLSSLRDRSSLRKANPDNLAAPSPGHAKKEKTFSAIQDLFKIMNKNNEVVMQFLKSILSH